MRRTGDVGGIFMARGSAAVARAVRLSEIPALLEAKPRKTSELAARFDVPVRTIQRDLQTLRERGLPIRSDRPGIHALPGRASALNPVEALAVHAATRLLYHHAPAQNRHYLAAMEKLAAMLPEPARRLALRSGDEIRRRPADDRALELVARAWFEGRVLACEYRASSGSGAWHANELEILLVEINRDNLAPYAIAYERTFHRAVRTWKLSRMRNVLLMDETYEIPDSFDPLAYLDNAWGVIGSYGAASVLVRLRFVAEAADRILEGGYPNLRICERWKDGSLLVEIAAGADSDGFPTEILPWVQSWGPRVDVLAPTALRHRWLEEARRVLVSAAASPDDAGRR